MSLLAEGAKGAEVKALQKRLKEKNFDPGDADGVFGPATEAAILAFQESEKLTPDGVAGPETLAALGLSKDEPKEVARKLAEDVSDKVTVAIVAKMCPGASLGNIKKYLPDLLKALVERELADKQMILMAIGTIAAETAGFEPISEFKSRFNTSPHGHPFDLYDFKKSLGNKGPPDGDSFKGRGFVQLTGRFNYSKLDKELGLGGALMKNPELANDSKVAAEILAQFIKGQESRLRDALQSGDLARARRLINGGSHGLEAFKTAYNTGKKLF
jgi:predicted chitinase